MQPSNLILLEFELLRYTSSALSLQPLLYYRDKTSPSPRLRMPLGLPMGRKQAFLSGRQGKGAPRPVRHAGLWPPRRNRSRRPVGALDKSARESAGLCPCETADWLAPRCARYASPAPQTPLGPPPAPGPPF